MISGGSACSVLSRQLQTPAPCMNPGELFPPIFSPQTARALEKRGGVSCCLLQQMRRSKQRPLSGRGEGRIKDASLFSEKTWASPCLCLALAATSLSGSDGSFSACPLNVSLPLPSIFRALSRYTLS